MPVLSPTNTGYWSYTELEFQFYTLRYTLKKYGCTVVRKPGITKAGH
jgi:hypothetical protein